VRFDILNVAVAKLSSTGVFLRKDRYKIVHNGFIPTENVSVTFDHVFEFESDQSGARSISTSLILIGQIAGLLVTD
jgi:hypothetical protein